MIRELINRGAHLNKVDNKGLSIIHIAAYQGDARTIQILMTARPRIDIQAVDGAGYTPLETFLCRHGFQGSPEEFLGVALAFEKLLIVCLWTCIETEVAMPRIQQGGVWAGELVDEMFYDALESLDI